MAYKERGTIFELRPFTMFPIGDDDSTERSVPVVTYLLIAVNVLFFFVELSGGEPFIERWSVVPRRLMANPGGSLTWFARSYSDSSKS